MLARETLLAEMLRTGRGLRMQLTVPGVTTIFTKELAKRGSDAMSTPFNAMTAALKSPALKGKLIGVELEYYPANGGVAYGTRGLTEQVGDGSLDHGGREIRKLTWAGVDGRLIGVVGLKLNGRVNSACGLHVHIDVRHLDGTQRHETYERLIKFYPFLKKLVPKSRLRNQYCKWVDNRNTGCRYAAINYRAASSHGTFEFRCQGGTINALKVETWALLCQHLVKVASNPLSNIPRSWKEFIFSLPEPLRSWCILRKEKLHGQSPLLNARTLSGIDLRLSTNLETVV